MILSQLKLVLCISEVYQNNTKIITKEPPPEKYGNDKHFTFFFTNYSTFPQIGFFTKIPSFRNLFYIFD